MTNDRIDSGKLRPSGLLARLARDQAGNTFAMVAAAIAPLLALVGGGIDMGRSYMTETRLQQACDAGVLAARKKMASTIVLDGNLTADAENAGNSFFDVNFRDGAYGSENLHFAMTLEADYTVSGEATVDVPTTIMRIFGNDNMALAVNCEAQVNYSNTDIMFVLDTTGSMVDDVPGTAPDGSEESRIVALRRIVKEFHQKMEDSKGPGTTIRYGFVPYSINVNVGGVLEPGWMKDRWHYQSRVVKDTGGTVVHDYYTATYVDMGGSITPITPYPATACPLDDYTPVYSPTTTVSTSPHEYWYTTTQNGTDYWCEPYDGQWMVAGQTFNNKVTKVTYKFDHTQTDPVYTYTYKELKNVDVSAIAADPASSGKLDLVVNMPSGISTPTPSEIWYWGCIEERDTYEIDDYSNIDFSKALDLDIDLVPTNNDKTQWAPMFPEIAWARSLDWGANGPFTPDDVDHPDDYLKPAWKYQAVCPSPARKLAEMDASEVASYVDSLYVGGSTYHDIGMIWGGRLLSPTGLFASENADVDGKPTARHLIFLTDGETNTVQYAYGAYGIEPLEVNGGGTTTRRFTPTGDPVADKAALDSVVEQRFTAACDQVKSKGITVWLIAFGTTVNPAMEACAGSDHHFEAQGADELSEAFSTIAMSIGELRITK